MQCGNGHSIEEGDTFCTVCGSAAQVAATPSRRNRYVAVAAVVATACIIALVFFGFRAGQSDKAAKSTQPPAPSATTVPSTSSTTSSSVVVTSLQNDPASAWQRVASTISSNAKVSPITNIAGTPTVVVGDTQALNSANPPYLTIWEYRNGAWATAIRQPLGLPTANIEFMDLTEDSALDVVVNAVAASESVSFVYSRTGATWGLVRWGPAKSESPAGQLFLDPDQKLYVSTRNCTPSCAEGGRINTYWIYDKASGTFVRQ
jgi:hypothetical protein